MTIFDYETLKLIWWLFIGVLLIGFAVMDGFDMGVAAWLPFLGKTDEERRVIINAVGPTWGRKPDLADYRRWCNFCCMATGLCGSIFRTLCCTITRVVCTIFPSRRF